jgi:glycosyltransferase involved in cell wall biosynthesis
MRAAIVHYHLHPGGVTRVIESAVQALRPHRVRIAILAGGPPEPPPALAGLVRLVPGLDYHEPVYPSLPPTTLADRLEHEAAAALGGEPDVWHIHNHSLGKNPAFTEAVRILAGRGRRLLLQIHDFAEDLRPNLIRLLRKHADAMDQSLGDYLYPSAPHLHYAVLNRRDGELLARAGAPPDQIHRLPNAIVPPPADAGADLPADPEQPPLLLYPVRAIRRKNLGEFLFWSALARAGERFAVTLAPQNPEERPAYTQWTSFAAACRLPVQFEWGVRSGRSLARLQRDATALATTSVAEGFGLAFLEPWLAGRPVTGRNLPEITADFTEAGVDLSGLYDRLLVPLEWIGAERFRLRVAAAYADLLAACGRTATPDAADRARQAACDQDRVDMGRLDEELQADVIRRILESPADAAAVTPAALVTAPCPASRLEHNRRAIAAAFGLEAYGQRLLALYRRVAASRANTRLDRLDAEVLLDAFLAPERFTLLRSPRNAP